LTWVSVRARPSADVRAAVVGALFDLGSQGVHEDGDSVVTHFPVGVSRDSITEALEASGYSGSVEYDECENVNWAEKWKGSFRVQQIGSLRISPPWLADESASPATLLINPGMAFGTGEHATTRCVLRMMERHMPRGATVADLGAGSGILSIAAALRGARAAIAIENDADAVSNAEENISINGVEDRVQFLEGDAELLLPLVAPVDFIVANIVSSVLLQLLPLMRKSLSSDGTVVVSGILLDESDAFLRSATGAGWTVLDREEEDIWCAFAIR
jgi:ribosomal protein L11 methyltransferase